HPLDFRQSVVDCGCQDVGPLPALVYNSGTVNVRPIFTGTLTSPGTGTYPTELKLQLTWNNGTPQSWVTFATTGRTPGDTVAVAAQVASPVAAPGRYPWAVTLRGTFADRGPVVRHGSGQAPVVVRDTASNPFGMGWGLRGFDQL